MTDRELLERLADWLGYEIYEISDCGPVHCSRPYGDGMWNPLASRNDCQPLLEKMQTMDGRTVFQFSFSLDRSRGVVWPRQNSLSWYALELLLATPRQICEAVAAAIGQ